jgi:glycogen operon protein
MVLNGNGLDEYNEWGERIADDTLLILLNANSTPMHFMIPDIGPRWEIVLNTYDMGKQSSFQKIVKSGESFRLTERTVIMMRRSNL